MNVNILIDWNIGLVIIIIFLALAFRRTVRDRGVN